MNLIIKFGRGRSDSVELSLWTSKAVQEMLEDLKNYTMVPKRRFSGHKYSQSVTHLHVENRYVCLSCCEIEGHSNPFFKGLKESFTHDLYKGPAVTGLMFHRRCHLFMQVFFIWAGTRWQSC